MGSPSAKEALLADDDREVAKFLIDQIDDVVRDMATHVGDRSPRSIGGGTAMTYQIVEKRWSLQFSNTPSSVTIWAAKPGHDPRNDCVAYLEQGTNRHEIRDAFEQVIRRYNKAAAHIEALAGLLVVARRYALPTSLERSIDTTLSNLREGQRGEQ